MRVPSRRHLLFAAGAALFLANLTLPGGEPPPSTGDPFTATDAAVDAWFDGERQDAGIPGAAVVVVRDGRVHVAAFGTADATGRPVTVDTPFLLGSVSKGLTALALGALAERGRLELDAPVRRYLPDFTLADPGAADAITVRELLAQTSGLPTAAGLAPLSAPASTLDARVRELASVAPVSAPGTAYHYSNANYVVLGRLVETVTGLPFDAALHRLVLDPLGMAHSSATADGARSAGLGDAHRLSFGIADTHPAPVREDLAPAGFVAASAADTGRYLAAMTDPDGPGGGRVTGPGVVRTLLAGSVPTGVGDERYAMGWVDTAFRGERMVAHAGSTTDSAAFVAILPGRRLAVAVLLDAQSPVYELLHKPDAIGTGVLALAMGQAPGGTFEHLYPVLDAVLLAAAAAMTVGLFRRVRSLRRGAGRPADRPAGPVAGRRWWRSAAGLAWVTYLDVLAPVVILLRAPDLLGAGWPVLVRTDLGLVLAILAGLRLADAGLRLLGWRLGTRTLVATGGTIGGRDVPGVPGTLG